MKSTVHDCTDSQTEFAETRPLMPVSRQQIIIRVFRKYSHSLGPKELEYLDEILKEHDISDEDVEMSIELIAKEYNKQDGSFISASSRARGSRPPFAKMLP
jgi:hypothetical protein